MNGIEQPGVSYSAEVLTGEPAPEDTAVPVFIGYTESGPQWSLKAINSLAEFQAAYGGPAPEGFVLCHAVRHYFDNGGRTAYALSLGPYSSLTDLSRNALLDALSDERIVRCVLEEERITLVCMPEMMRLSDTDTDGWAEAWSAVSRIVQARRGLFGILDTPEDPAMARACLDRFVKQQADAAQWTGAYWPRLQTDYVDDAGAAITVPASAAVAAVMAVVDDEYGVWCAPANVALSRVVTPTRPWLQSSGLFQTYGASINLIRSFPDDAVRIWGCRTLIQDASSPWLYVHIRRTLSWIEAEVQQIARPFMFEANILLTWIRLRGIVHIWLRELWLEGGLYGEQESDAFFIQIGLGETMSQDDIDQGRMIMNIGVAVAYPAEFIEVSLTLDTRSSLVSSLESI
ncbi:phage tail sheath subtilisin-like domain-containing protein [Caballeronia sp. LZ034LL]|uniref:phage tail sheath subtilisin-like domain-containing protein n=1 Tax=Caballeronia sp. LZ034LL TaxID=3038567 RepID=UPI0028598BBD|nr:phage tail sheath subtilisin-like domain-containing protein [Caballeronia sp. LZ034LL]MDR5837923.1 phage tail sheath subtilisin-like domain-containing protein [Caballeronia sp. LZ034LL]